MSSITITTDELAALVKLVSGFNHSEGELRMLLATARMFAAKEGGPSLSADDLLNAAMTAEAVSTFRAAHEQSRAGGGVE